MTNYDYLIERLEKGNPNISNEEKKDINDFVDMIISKSTIGVYDIPIVSKIILICNIIYNNAPNILSPLDDDKYDKLIVLCRRQNIQYPIGAPPIQFNTVNQEPLDMDTSNSPKVVMEIVPNRDKMFYFNELTKNQYPVYGDFIVDETVDTQFKKQRSINHSYDMCGTLDKCKFVLNDDAKRVGAFLDPVNIFERDFLGKHIQMGVVDPNNITLIASLKYDGISVEATVEGDKIISACTRGDLDTDNATDLTPILYGLTFSRATGKLDPKETLGIKFELIVTRRNLSLIQQISNLSYVNSRNAIIGLMGRLDSRRFRDYVTPVPLESTLKMNLVHQYAQNWPRVLELEFLNTYFSKGIDMRYTVFTGNYAEVLYKLKKFVEEADFLRAYSDFQYDGIVVEYADPMIRNKLGKNRAIPNYAIAIKFPPMKRISTFTHYTYSVGQTGCIVPKAHFLPVDFMGQIHDKTTVHSLKRFNNLRLRAGDKVELTLNNDVIVYLIKAADQEQNNNPYEEFPTHCPSCGSPLVMSDSGDSAYCPNFMCNERCIGRLSSMLARLNIKGFSTETIRALNVYTLRQLIDTPLQTMQNILGEIKGKNLRHIIDNELLVNQYEDYRILGAIGFTNIAANTWKSILMHIRMETIANGTDEQISSISSISGIGPKTVETIITERKYFREELYIALNQMHPIMTTNSNNYSRGQVRFTGTRDEQLCKLFMDKGYDASSTGSFTNKTTILIIPYLGFQSTKVDKAFHVLNSRLSQFRTGQTISGYNDLDLVNQYQLFPKIMTVQEAYAYIESI